MKQLLTYFFVCVLALFAKTQTPFYSVQGSSSTEVGYDAILLSDSTILLAVTHYDTLYFADFNYKTRYAVFYKIASDGRTIKVDTLVNRGQDFYFINELQVTPSGFVVQFDETSGDNCSTSYLVNYDNNLNRISQFEIPVASLSQCEVFPINFLIKFDGNYLFNFLSRSGVHQFYEVSSSGVLLRHTTSNVPSGDYESNLFKLNAYPNKYFIRHRSELLTLNMDSFSTMTKTSSRVVGSNFLTWSFPYTDSTFLAANFGTSSELENEPSENPIYFFYEGENPEFKQKFKFPYQDTTIILFKKGFVPTASLDSCIMAYRYIPPPVGFRSYKNPSYLLLRSFNLNKLKVNWEFEIHRPHTSFVNPFVIQLNANEYLVYVSALDSSKPENNYDLFMWKFNARGEVITGINKIDVPKHSQLVVWPNPARQELKIKNDKESNIKTINIFDVTGKLLQSQSWLEYQEELTLSVQSMLTGIYILQAVSKDGLTRTTRFIKE